MLFGKFSATILLRLESSTVVTSIFSYGYSPKFIVKRKKGALSSFAPFSKNMGCSFSKQTHVITKTETTNKREASDVSSNKDEDSEEIVEEVVCKNSDIGENEMKVFDIRDVGKVLLVRQNGKLSALGTKCTHYGAPLVNGALGDGRIRCQWHGACFNISNGDIEEFPGLDSLPCYQVTVENNDVKVKGLVADFKSNKRIKISSKPDFCNKKHFVIIGGGPSGAVCAETLRYEGFTGKITLICRENYLPYDRIKIDKIMDIKIDALKLRDTQFYEQNKIDVKLNCKATSIDTNNKEIQLVDGSSIKYDSVYIATGSGARKVPIPGHDLKNVVVIRELDDASYIDSQLSSEKHVVVLGSSFIGMEAAAYCSSKVEKVTVISRDTVPFENSFGPKVGKAVLKLFTEKGVSFIPESGLKHCIGTDKLESVELLNGEIIKADICIMGVGGSYNTEFLKESGLNMNASGAIEVNEYLQTNVPNVFAGGDIAYAPVYVANNIKVAIGHYGLAQYHGKKAALNMLNKNAPLKAIPYFWTTLFGKGIRYAGYGEYDDVIYSGDVDELKFVAYYLKNDEVISIASCQMDPIVSQYAEYVNTGKRLHRQDLQEDSNAWTRK